jgi:hypothetical protein
VKHEVVDRDAARVHAQPVRAQSRSGRIERRHGAEAVAYLRKLKALGVTREAMEAELGYSDLPRYERLLQLQPLRKRTERLVPRDRGAKPIRNSRVSGRADRPRTCRAHARLAPGRNEAPTQRICPTSNRPVRSYPFPTGSMLPHCKLCYAP